MSDYFNNDNRICKVLQILEHKRSASLEYLEKKLNVSTKSIKNDIKELNEIFLDTLEMLKKEHTINTLYASQNSINRGNNPILLIY